MGAKYMKSTQIKSRNLCLMLSTALTAVGMVGFSTAAVRAADATPEMSGIEEVVVTAQKRSQSVEKVGITINVFTNQMLEDKGVKSAEDMALLTPGLTINETAATGVPIYTIRGVGFTDYATAASSTVGLYFDEVAIPYTVMSRGLLFDVDRVEVLKGPQGDLYGRNTTAGQINFISRKPTKTLQAGATASYERFNILDVDGYVSGPIADKVQGRLAVKTTQSLGNDAWQKSISRPGDKLGKKDVFAARAMLNFDIAENSSLLLNAHWVKDKSDNTASTAYNGTLIGLPQQSLPTNGTPNFSVGDNRAADWTNSYNGISLRPKRDNDLKGMAINLNVDIKGMTLTSITGYDKFTRTESNDWDGSAINDSSNINNTDLKVFSQEVRLSSASDQALTWIVGGYYSWDKMKEQYHYFMSDSFFGFALGINTLDTRYEQTTKSKAGFAHAEWKVADKVTLIGGLRYTKEDRSWTGCTYDSGDGTLAAGLNNIIVPAFFLANGLPNPGLAVSGGCGTYNDVPGIPGFGTFNPYSDTVSTSKWMWKGGVNYEPTKDTLLYATASHGFKSGGFNGANSNTVRQLLPYKPETLTSYEVGFKASMLQRTVQWNMSAFWYDYRNKQEQDLAVTPVGNISGLTNVPKSRIRGAELELRWLPAKGLTFDVGGAYLNTLIQEWQAVSRASLYPNVVYFDASGLQLANSPKWQLNGTATYEFPITSNLNMMVASDVIYKGSTTGGAKLLTDATDSYTLVNARIGISDADGRWHVTAWGKNIFNKYYFPSAFIGGNGPYVRVNGMPVTWGLTLGFKY
jgi:iron complex outermembrane receptor protein